MNCLAGLGVEGGGWILLPPRAVAFDAKGNCCCCFALSSSSRLPAQTCG